MTLLPLVTDALAVMPDPVAALDASGGLNGLWNSIRTNWIQPLFFAAVAVFALVFIKDRAWMKLIAFVGIAAVVGVLIFASESLFGANGNLTKTAKGGADKVNGFGIVAPAYDALGNPLT